MKHYRVAPDIKVDINRLRNAYEVFKDNLGFTTDDPSKVDFNAICINRKPGDSRSIVGGNVRGLYWTYADESGKEEQRLEKVEEESFTEICPDFEATYIEEVYNNIQAKYKVGRVRFIMKPPRSCLSWHRDPDKRIHIPIITNPGCRMVIEDESFHLPADGRAYITDNTKYHNFFNGSEIDRVHLVAILL